MSRPQTKVLQSPMEVLLNHVSRNQSVGTIAIGTLLASIFGTLFGFTE